MIRFYKTLRTKHKKGVFQLPRRDSSGSLQRVRGPLCGWRTRAKGGRRTNGSLLVCVAWCTRAAPTWSSSARHSALSISHIGRMQPPFPLGVRDQKNLIRIKKKFSPRGSKTIKYGSKKLPFAIFARLQDQGTRGPQDQGTKGPRDQGTRGPEDRRTTDHRTGGPEPVRTRAPGEALGTEGNFFLILVKFFLILR